MANDYVSIKDRNIYFSGNVNTETMSKIQEAIIEINIQDDKLKERNPIHLYINSWGGCTTSMFGLIDVILSSETPVYTYNNGVCSSAGFKILIAGKKRFGRKNSTYLLHQVIVGGYDEDIQRARENMKFYDNVQQRVEEYILSQTKITKEFLDNIVKSKIDYYFFSEEAIELGVIDEII